MVYSLYYPNGQDEAHVLQQMLHDSLTILRRPTLSTLQAHSRDEWRGAFLYLTIGIVIATLIQLATTVVQAPLLRSRLDGSRHRLYSVPSIAEEGNLGESPCSGPGVAGCSQPARRRSPARI